MSFKKINHIHTLIYQFVYEHFLFSISFETVKKCCQDNCEDHCQIRNKNEKSYIWHILWNTFTFHSDLYMELEMNNLDSSANVQVKFENFFHRDVNILQSYLVLLRLIINVNELQEIRWLNPNPTTFIFTFLHCKYSVTIIVFRIFLKKWFIFT